MARAHATFTCSRAAWMRGRAAGAAGCVSVSWLVSSGRALGERERKTPSSALCAGLAVVGLPRYSASGRQEGPSRLSLVCLAVRPSVVPGRVCLLPLLLPLGNLPLRHTHTHSHDTHSLSHTHTPTHPIALLTHLARPSHHLDTRPPAAPACHPSHAPTPVIARLRTAVGRRRSAYCATPASAPAPAPATALPRPRLLSTSWARDQP